MSKSGQIYYERLGNPESEKTLVLIHGASGTGESLKPLSQGLLEYNVIILDLQGHFRSEGSAEFIIGEYTRDIKDLIKELRKEGLAKDDVTLIGHSMGGGITLDCAIKDNIQEVKRVVIMNSGASFDTITPEFVEKLSRGEYDTAFLEACFTPYTDPAIIEYFMANKDTVMASIEASYADFSAVLAFDERDKLHKVKVPTLILSGEIDRITPVESSYELDNNIENSQLITYPKVGHMLPIEQPQIVAKDIIEFINNN